MEFYNWFEYNLQSSTLKFLSSAWSDDSPSLQKLELWRTRIVYPISVIRSQPTLIITMLYVTFSCIVRPTFASNRTSIYHSEPTETGRSKYSFNIMSKCNYPLGGGYPAFGSSSLDTSKSGGGHGVLHASKWRATTVVPLLMGVWWMPPVGPSLKEGDNLRLAAAPFLRQIIDQSCYVPPHRWHQMMCSFSFKIMTRRYPVQQNSITRFNLHNKNISFITFCLMLSKYLSLTDKVERRECTIVNYVGLEWMWIVPCPLGFGVCIV